MTDTIARANNEWVIVPTEQVEDIDHDRQEQQRVDHRPDWVEQPSNEHAEAVDHDRQEQQRVDHRPKPG